MRTALIAGSSGLVGTHLLDKLVRYPAYSRVVSLGRRRVALEHPRLEQLVADFNRLHSVDALDGIKVDDAFCSLGTTIRAAGSQDAFRKVDFDHILAFAKTSKQLGARRFCVISAVGADPQSKIFYSRIKGETEEALGQIGFESLHIFRPGLLTGYRAERRIMEKGIMLAMPVINPLLAGSLKIYRSIPAERVASAMIGAAADPIRGIRIHTYNDINDLADFAGR